MDPILEKLASAAGWAGLKIHNTEISFSGNGFVKIDAHNNKGEEIEALAAGGWTLEEAIAAFEEKARYGSY